MFNIAYARVFFLETFQAEKRSTYTGIFSNCIHNFENSVSGSEHEQSDVQFDILC